MFAIQRNMGTAFKIAMLLVVLATAGLFSYLSLTGQQATEASNLDGLNLTGVTEIQGDGTQVMNLTAEVSIVDPRAPTRLKITFKVTGDTGGTVTDEGALKPGDEIIITLEDDFGFVINTPLVASQITIASDRVNKGAVLDATLANETRNPSGVSVHLVSPENDEPEITLIIPDMSTDHGSGTNSIADGATVTVIFQPGAGIVNPSEGLRNNVSVRTSEDQVDDTIKVDSIARMKLTDVRDDRGSVETLLAIGVEGNESVIIFLDNDGDGVLDPAESALCNVIADRDDFAQCEITLSTPPFELRKGSGSCNLADVGTPEFFCNYINFVDSENRTTGFPNPLTQDLIDRQTFELEPKVVLENKDIQIGKTTKVSLFDFPPNELITEIIISRKSIFASQPDPLVTDADGQLDFVLTVPLVNDDDGGQILPGTRRLDVFAGGEDNDANINLK